MSSQDSNPPNVFISYSHDSSEHKDQVLELSDRLRAHGIDCNIDQYEEFSPPEGWPRWTEKQIREADFVLIVCSEIFCRRVTGEETPGLGRGALWEGNAIYQLLYNAGTLNTQFIPVLLENGKPEHIPIPLQGTKYYSLSTEEAYEQLYRKLTNQPSTPQNELGQRKTLPPRPRRQKFPTSETQGDTNMSENIGDKINQTISGNNNNITAQSNNSKFNQSQISQSSDEQITATEVVKMLAYLEEKIQSLTALSEVNREKSVKHLEVAKVEIQEYEPNKDSIANSLKRVNETLNNAGKTTKEVKELVNELFPTVTKVAGYLGYAAETIWNILP